VFDSGFGGLTVLRELQRVLPRAAFVYLGDNGRAPYGGRDADVILDFSEQCVERLLDEGCRLVVVACHTVSSVALRHLQRRYAGVERALLGVTIPAAELAVRHCPTHIAFVGTARTVHSGTFATEVAKLGSQRVTQVAAPLLAPLVEEGWTADPTAPGGVDPVARLAVARYCAGLGDVDGLVLGCTHYPLLRSAFEAALPGVPVLDPAPYVAERLVEWLGRHPDFAPAAGSVRLLSTGDPVAVGALGARLYGGALPVVEHVAEQAGRLSPATPAIATGQVVRG
jgi:glutamate racemase